MTHDVVVIGGGPGGLAAALTAASEGLRVALVERAELGGQAGKSPLIRNYPGFPSVTGAELTDSLLSQAGRFGVEFYHGEVSAVKENGKEFLVETSTGPRESRAVIVAVGLQSHSLPVLDKSFGGVLEYRPPSDLSLAADRDVVVIGAGNSAGQAAVALAGVARSVTLMFRTQRVSDTMSHYLVGELTEAGVRLMPGSDAIACDGTLLQVAGPDGKTRLNADCVYACIGGKPATKFLSGFVELWDVDKSVVATGRMETTRRGVFAVGDCRLDSPRRIAPAVGDAAVAVSRVHKFLGGLQ